MRATRVVVEQCAGRVPVVAGVADARARRQFAAEARDGRDAVIAMTPYVNKLAGVPVLAYYRAIAEAARLPVFIQNHEVSTR